MLVRGNLQKMKTTLASPVVYQLPVGDELVTLNNVIGSPITFRFVKEINCIHCGRKTNKSFSQGYCYPCFKSLAQCDMCIVKPETCHFHEGTCREPDWAVQHCLQDTLFIWLILRALKSVLRAVHRSRPAGSIRGPVVRYRFSGLRID